MLLDCLDFELALDSFMQVEELGSPVSQEAFGNGGSSSGTKRRLSGGGWHWRCLCHPKLLHHCGVDEVAKVEPFEDVGYLEV